MFENILEIHQNDANLNDIKDSSIFYFQKGQDAINKWLDMELSDALKEKIVALSLDYDQFKNIAISDTVLYPIQQLLFEIISYCDEKANDKKKYNQYEDKRTLAQAGVRMGSWIKSLIEYKFDRQSVIGSAKNAFDYLLDPTNNSTVLSENHREYLTTYYFNKSYQPEFFTNDLKKIFESYNLLVENENNYTHYISWLIYSYEEDWKPKKPITFKQLSEKLSRYFIENNVNFKILQEGKRAKYVWIGNNDSIIGDMTAHYEVGNRGKKGNNNEIYVDVHFEAKNKINRDLFYKTIQYLPENLEWIDWDKSKSIGYKESFNLKNHDAIAENITSALEYIDNSIGDLLREIISSISDLSEINVKKEFIDWMIANVSGGNYFEKQFDSDRERFEKEINEYEVKYKELFDPELFIINVKDYQKEIELRSTNIYKPATAFSEYSNNLASGRPKAILGKNNYLRFLEEKFSKMNTKKYWLYAPGENAIKWEEFYNQGIMGLGWDNLGDLDDYKSKNEIKAKLQEHEGVSSTKQNDTAANYDFHKVIKPGDVIIVKKGISELLGYGIVTSDYFYDETRESFQKCRKVDWQLKGNWKVDFNLVQKTLTDITKFPTEDTAYSKYYERLLGIMEGKTTSNNKAMDDNKLYKDPINQILYGPPGTGKTYTLKTDYFPKYTLKETSITKELFFEETVRNLTWWQVIALALVENGTSRVNDIFTNRWVALKANLSESKNVRATIWGTLQMHTIQESKTVAYTQRQTPFIFDKKVDKSWMLLESELKEQSPEVYDILESVNNFKANPEKEIKHYVFTTFHQSFSYEDFIEGIKPKMDDETETNELTYKIEPGIFKELCTRAQSDPSNRYAIFIDEINRGNVSQIFGELITLIETDKRLGAVNQMKVKLPYSKKEFGVPSNIDIYGTMNTADRSVEALDTALRRRFSFKELMPNSAVVDKKGFTDYPRSVIMEKMNNRIEVLLDRNHTLGHAYFIKPDFKHSFENEIIPLLQEYFYNDYGKIGLVLGKGFVREKSIAKTNDKSIFADFETKNEVDILKSYELTPFNEVDFDVAIQTLLE